MIRIDASQWSKRNLWPLPSGELAVRPGLRTEFDGSVSLAGRTVCDAFSVIDPVTGFAWFYLTHHADGGSAGNVKINVYDDNWTLFQEYDTGSDAIPEVVTHAEVLDFIVINSPSFPTAFGLVGGGLVRAEKQNSLNTSLTALDIPEGLCVAWASSRVVYARGSSLFISDPVTATGGDPRTIVPENQVVLEAPIYGLHTTAGGALVACTAKGVWALSEQAAAGGQVPVGDWRRLSDHETLRYKTTAQVNGRLWGLTRKGIRLIDTEGAQEVPLDDPHIDIQVIPTIQHNDYRRAATIMAGPDGPVISSRRLGAVCMVDELSGIRSWWTDSDSAPSLNIVGVMTHATGETVLMDDEDALRVTGNTDTGEAIADGSDITGFLIGRQKTPVDGSAVIREVTAACDGGTLAIYIRGDGGEVNVTHEHEVGTATWQASPTSEDPEIRSARKQFSERTDDFSIVIGTKPQRTRLSTEIAVKVAGPGRRGRP